MCLAHITNDSANYSNTPGHDSQWLTWTNKCIQKTDGEKRAIPLVESALQETEPHSS